MTAWDDVRRAAESLSDKGQRLFSPAELINEARQLGSRYPEPTLRTHVVSHMCANASGATADPRRILYRTSRGLYRLRDASDPALPSDRDGAVTRVRSKGGRRRSRAEQNTDALIADFARSLSAFEAASVFGGPSLYFHIRAIETGRAIASTDELLSDQRFLEYVYAVLPSWGMHRMGKAAAKVPDFSSFSSAIRGCAADIDELRGLDVTSIHERDVEVIGDRIWMIIERLRSSSSNARLVSGSKTLHHVLPSLVPPIDGEYTLTFFTGTKQAYWGEREAFAEMWPLLCRIGRSRAEEIRAAVGRPEVMATSTSKVIDNAIMGFVLKRRTALPSSEDGE